MLRGVFNPQNQTLTSGCFTDSFASGSAVVNSITLSPIADSLDEPDEVLTLTLSADPDNPLPAGVTISATANTTGHTIRDDDPTIVSLARVGSGAVTEGGKVEFTVTLGRALIAGETIDVPLSIGGTAVTTGDWSLALKSSTTNTGVTLSDAGTTTPEVSFINSGAQTATLELTATPDGTVENAETFEIALGANSAFDANALDTNVGGGADPHGTNNEFDVTVNDGGTTPQANNAPTVANAIPNQTATVGTAFSYAFPANTFSDADSDSLTYAATKSDDTALPSWLTFTAVSRAFSGTPQVANVGTLSVKVTANDGNSGTVSDTFDIVVSNTGTLGSSTITISGGHEVREGRGAEFTLTASPARAADTVININVTETGTFLAGSPGTRTVTIPTGRTSHTFTVATVNDGGRDAFGDTGGVESDGSVTATVDTGTGYTVGSPSSATVDILDDDTNAASGNYIRVSGHGDRIQHENDRGSRHFRVSRFGLPTATTGDWGFKLCFAGTATPGVDYSLDNHFREEAGIAIGADGCTAQRTIPGGDDRYHFYISHFDDPHAEGTETIVVTVTGLNNVFFSDQPGINIIRFTIVDDDTPAAPKPQQGEQDAQPAQIETPSCVSDALLADAQAATTETWRTSPGHVERWSRVLAAFGVDNAYSNNPMTVAEAQAQADRGLKRWSPVAPALECLANPPQEEPEQAEEQPAEEEPATPELSLSAGSAVDEGGNATFTITADPAPQSNLTIAWTVAQSGEYLAAPGAGTRTVVLTAGATSIALSVATMDDAADEVDGSVSVTLGTGTGYTVATGKGSAAVTVRDNDEPVVSIAAGSGVTEGAAASFTVSASPAPAAPLDVTLSVSQSGDFADSGETGSRTVTVPVTGSVTFEVATVDDSADEPDGSITATLGTGTGYTVAAAPDNAATVAVSDNDAAASGPTISIADATMKENQRNGYFTVTLSEKVAWPVHVYYATRDSTPVSAVAGEDYLAWQRSWQLRARFQPGQTETQIHVPLYNDSHDEDPETFELVLFNAEVNGPPGVSVSIADGVAVGTITD